MRLSEIAGVLEGGLRGADIEFSGVGTDTREDLSGRLFVALRGERFDGHGFLDRARQAGAVAALVEEPAGVAMPQVVVSDTRRALGLLARHWRRSRFRGTVIGITGSNGKTTLKEMTAACLGGEPGVLKTRGNLNNDIGVPLTLLELDAGHRFAVVEMGANHEGEIAWCASLAEPAISVLNNVGPAHLEGFGSIEGVARAKGEIVAALPETGIAVLNADDRFYGYHRDLAGRRRVVSFGFGEADVRGLRVEPLAFRDGRFHNRFEAEVFGERLEMEIQLAGRHNVANALAAMACAVAAGCGKAGIRRGLASLAPVPGRLRPLPAGGGAWILDDCYNANPASFAAGLEALRAIEGERWVILGAFGELGPESAAWHRRAGELARQKGVRRLLAVGEASRPAATAFGREGEWFPSREALIETVAANMGEGICILIKGSRSQRLETVVEALREH